MKENVLTCRVSLDSRFTMVEEFKRLSAQAMEIVRTKQFTHGSGLQTLRFVEIKST
jgi:hypothetical protein